MKRKTNTNTVKQILAKVMIAILLVVSVISFSSCTPKVELAKPENTNLKYWLLDGPNKEEWTKLHGDVLTNTYLASGYEPVLNEYGNWESPEHAVVYFTENYPIEEIGIQKITGIYITDPEIHVWGLTVNSTREEVIEVMEKIGFKEKQVGSNIYSADNGRYRVIFRFDSKQIEIRYTSFGIIEYLIASYYYN